MPDADRLMCWAHVLRNVDRYLKAVREKKVRETIREDISILQVAPNRVCFKHGIYQFKIQLVMQITIF